MSHKSKLYVVRYQQRVNIQVRHHSNSFLYSIELTVIGSQIDSIGSLWPVSTELPVDWPRAPSGKQ